MSVSQSISSKASVRANNPADDAAARYAYAADGGIMLLDCGRYRPATRSEAVAVVADLHTSPFPSSQERARQIRAALRETMQ